MAIYSTSHLPSKCRSYAKEKDDREMVLVRWGLIPHWAKDAKIGNSLINARADTVAEKPAFRCAFKRLAA
jgi:putative SOS response-associated peptidase YedK